MRDRDAQASLRHYRYCVVRVRMPDSLVLQATFFPAETISKVRHVVYSAVTEELEAYPFSLVDPSGRVVTDDTVSNQQNRGLLSLRRTLLLLLLLLSF